MTYTFGASNLRGEIAVDVSGNTPLCVPVDVSRYFPPSTVVPCSNLLDNRS